MMKKREKGKRGEKVVQFPDLDKRLLDKGLDSLQSKQYKAAVDYLQQAAEISEENEEIHIALVLAYFESGALTEAKEQSEFMLQSGIGEYIQVVDMYLMILIELHQYQEIITFIECLLEEKEVPKEKYEHFSRILEFCRRMDQPPVEEKVEEDIIAEPLQLQKIIEQKDQLIIAGQLADKNIVPFIEEILSYLRSKEGQPFFKSLLINVLKQHLYNKETTVEKMGRTEKFVPAELPGIDDFPQQKRIESIIRKLIEHEDPILFEHTKGLAQRHFFMIYPFEMRPYEDHLLAAGYHLLASEYLGLEISLEEVTHLYEISAEDLQSAKMYLQKIEEFSYSKI